MAQRNKDSKTNNNLSEVVNVRIHPRAKKNGISGILDDGTIKISLTAPPADGKANQQLINLLSNLLEIDKSDIDIISGKTARNKLVRLKNCPNKEIINKLKSIAS